MKGIPGLTLTALNDRMDFDHVIRVHDDGTVTDVPDVYAPDPEEVLFDLAGLPARSPEPNRWRLLTGYSGQYSYSGPVMHPSEFIGGRLARDILATPGLYVAIVIWADDPDDEPDGWAVAYREQ